MARQTRNGIGGKNPVHEGSVLISVTFVKPHTHEGRQFRLGDKTTVNERAYQKLRIRGVIKE